MRWRISIILTLLLLPIVACLVVGVVAVWRTSSLTWLWWFVPLSWSAAYALTRWWRRELKPPNLLATDQATHWTSRDEAAWQLVEARQHRVDSLDPEQLAGAAIYVQTAEEMAIQLSRHYHTHGDDPFGELTVPEVLAAVQLAVEDSAQWVDQYIPGSHLLTITQWKALSRAPKWMKVISNATWAARIVMQPAFLAQYLTTRMATQSTANQVRDNALAWFFLAYVRYVGFYLIEMNSGRLRAGAARYREAMSELAGARSAERSHESREPTSGEPPSHEPPSHEPRPDENNETLTSTPERSTQVTIALVGQVNAGKSSVINAMLGENQATIDVLPATSEVKRHTLRLEDAPEELILLDTPGYGSIGATPAQREQTHTAVSQADLVLLVMNVTNPARQPDHEVLRDLEAQFATDLSLKAPAIVGVLTHADGLSPARQWEPPYDWTQPTQDKERSMAAAAMAVHEEFDDRLAAVVPVCADVQRSRSYGIHEWLVPTILVLLDDARGCAVLKSLHADMNRGQLQTLFRQLGNAGLGILKACFASR